MPNDNSRNEDLEGALTSLVLKVITIAAFLCEIVRSSPHSTRTELHVKALITLVDLVRLCSPGTMKELHC